MIQRRRGRLQSFLFRDRAMPRILIEKIVVGSDAIDMNGHVNNQKYIGWMQDVATTHSQQQGWSLERYFSVNKTWVIRSHTIEYIRPAFKSDELLVATWVASVDAQTSLRRYRFVRARDKKTVVEAQTLWVFCDIATGRPADIIDEVRAAFPVVDDDELTRALEAE